MFFSRSPSVGEALPMPMLTVVYVRTPCTQTNRDTHKHAGTQTHACARFPRCACIGVNTNTNIITSMRTHTCALPGYNYGERYMHNHRHTHASTPSDTSMGRMADTKMQTESQARPCVQIGSDRGKHTYTVTRIHTRKHIVTYTYADQIIQTASQTQAHV